MSDMEAPVRMGTMTAVDEHDTVWELWRYPEGIMWRLEITPTTAFASEKPSAPAVFTRPQHAKAWARDQGWMVLGKATFRTGERRRGLDP